MSLRGMSGWSAHQRQIAIRLPRNDSAITRPRMLVVAMPTWAKSGAIIAARASIVALCWWGPGSVGTTFCAPAITNGDGRRSLRCLAPHDQQGKADGDFGEGGCRSDRVARTASDGPPGEDG